MEPSFSGISFLDLSFVLYKNFGACLFAVGTPNPSYYRKEKLKYLYGDKVKVSPDDFDLFLNPELYTFKGGEMSFFIASSRDIINHISQLSSEQLKSMHSSAFSDTFFSPIIRNSGKLRTASSLSTKETLNNNSDSAEESCSLVTSVKILKHAMGLSSSYLSVDQDKNQASIKYPNVLPSSISKHILVCNSSQESFPRNMEYFIAPLRSEHLLKEGNFYPIVIISPTMPNKQQRQLLCNFKDLYIIKGDPMSRLDLQRVGVERVRKVIILANSSKVKHAVEKIGDSCSLLIALNVEAMVSEDVDIITEFIHTENVKFLGETEKQLNPKSRSTLMEPYTHFILRPGTYLSKISIHGRTRLFLINAGHNHMSKLL